MIYELIIIGGGPAGYIAAQRVAQSGKKVLLIEENAIGGVCLNEGCIPTKTMLYSAKIKDMANTSKKYGVEISEASLNHKRVLQRKNKIIKKLCAGIMIKLNEYKVEIIEGRATIEGQNTDGFSVRVDGESSYRTKKILLATGSSAVIPPIKGIDEAIATGYALTNKEVLSIKELPKKMVIIGGGVIGIEIAGYFNSAGCDITVIEMLDTIGGNIDKDIADILQKEYTKKGIKFILSSKVSEIEQGKVHYIKDDEQATIECDNVLLSVGRKPNVTNIGAEIFGIKKDNGFVVDDRMQTNVEGIYCAGDATGKVMLAHVAYRQAEVVANNILGIDDKMKYQAIPSVIYTNPEVASVGITKDMADAFKMDVIEKSISMNYSGRYMAENEAGQGIAKVIVDKKTNTLVGVHIIGSYASEIIYGAGIMIEQALTIDQIKKQVFPHPTNSEIIRDAIFDI